jgi:hypothetical protein
VRGSATLRVSAYFGTTALLLALVLPGPAQEQPKESAAPSPSSGVRVSPTQQGDSVRFYLPDSWVARFWKGEPSVKPYVAQLPPHKLDTEEQFAPCLPPPRIATGYLDANNVVHEKLAACVNFCDSRPQGKLFYNHLWGRLTRVDKVNVFVKEDGMLDVKIGLKELGGSEIRSRHLSVKGPREPLPEGEAGACTAE